MYGRIFRSVIDWYRSQFTDEILVRVLSSGVMSSLLLENIFAIVVLCQSVFRVSPVLVVSKGAYFGIAVGLIVGNLLAFKKIDQNRRAGKSGSRILTLSYTIGSFVLLVGAVALKLHLAAE
jgi:hypothetical protein